MADNEHTQPDRPKVGPLYPPLVGLIYLFNLIVGTGALAIPKAFGGAGWLISVLLIILLALFSFITTTFVIETMSSINAVRHWARIQSRRRMSDEVLLLNAAEVPNASQRRTSINAVDDTVDTGSTPDGTETTPLMLASSQSSVPSPFEITETIEMGEMASTLFNKVGITLFYICIIVYLYGDLAIYAVAVPKSIRDVICLNSSGSNTSQAATADDLCFSTSSLRRIDVYRIFVAAFAVILGPFTFFNLQKTMYLQIGTSLLRWTSFILMILLTVIRLSMHGGEGHPPVFNVHGVTNLFGVCVYAFMCHHSLPQMATPIRDKSAIFRLFAADYFLIMAFYLLICFTAVFTFSEISDLYTLNFGPQAAQSSANPITTIVFFQYFLALFPVFTLSSSFPIIAITLRNNLKTLFRLCRQQPNQTFPWVVDRIGFPLLALVIPVAVALGTEDVQLLVGFTGSYAGAAIQYLLPASFVLLVRRLVYNTPGLATRTNPYRSPFYHSAWCICVFVWSVVCIAIVTADHILSAVSFVNIHKNSTH